MNPFPCSAVILVRSKEANRRKATVAARVQKRAPNEPEQRARDEPERQAQRDDPLLAPRYNLRPRRGRAPEPVLDPAPQQEQECEGNGLCLHLEHDDDGHIKKLHTCALPANAHEYTIKKSHKKVCHANLKNQCSVL